VDSPLAAEPKVAEEAQRAAEVKVAEQDCSATCRDSILQIDYGNIHVAFRAGANPTGIRAVSFRDLMSTTETSFVCSLAT